MSFLCKHPKTRTSTFSQKYAKSIFCIPTVLRADAFRRADRLNGDKNLTENVVVVIYALDLNDLLRNNVAFYVIV